MPRILCLALFALLLAAAPAQAATRGRCVVGTTGGPLCTVWTGHVTFVADGDTFDVDVGGIGHQRIRITGIQAMEQSVYSSDPGRRRGQCHALPATARLNQIVRKARGRVRIAAQSTSSSSFGRPRRSVAARIGGRWVDIGKLLIAEGHVLWDPSPVEWAFNREYNRLVQAAALRGRNLWAPVTCGAGPRQAARLRVLVNFDAQGDDTKNLNGEYVRVENLGGAGTVSLAGWWIRDSALRRFTFPAGASVPEGGAVTMHVGRGNSHDGVFYWNQSGPAFENVSDDARALGDGAYLFDPAGDLRAWMIYPCRVACSDPARGRIEISADYEGRDEHIDLRNVSAEPIGLDGYLIRNDSNVYDLGRHGVALGPGETLELYSLGRSDDDTRLRKHWGMDRPLLANSGATVELRSFDDRLVDCYAWGSGRCPR